MGPLGHFGPAPQRGVGLLQQLQRIAGSQAEVGEGEPARSSRREAPERVQGLVEVEVRRRCRRTEHAGAWQSHPDRVSAHEQEAAVAVVEAEVVLGVARRVDAGELPSGPDGDRLAVAEHGHALRRRRCQPAVQRVEQIAVDHGRRTHQPIGVDQMALPLFVHVHGRRGKAAATSPTPPCWSRWMWVTTTLAGGRFGPRPSWAEVRRAGSRPSSGCRSRPGTARSPR